MKLVTVDDVKLFMEKVDSDQDDLIELIIDSVSARIERYLNRYLLKQQYTEYFDGGYKTYFLHAPPIDTTKPINIYVSNTEQVLDSDVFVYEGIGALKFKYDTEVGVKNVKVVYTGGYESMDDVILVPNDLKYACLLQSVSDFKNRDTLGIGNITLPDGSMRIIQDTFLPQVKNILNQYRLHPIVK